MFEAVEGMRQEHAELEGRLALPETHADQRLAKQLNQRYAELTASNTLFSSDGGGQTTRRRPPAVSGRPAPDVGYLLSAAAFLP